MLHPAASRIVLSTIVSFLLAALIAGCGGSGESQSGASTTEPNASTNGPSSTDGAAEPTATPEEEDAALLGALIGDTADLPAGEESVLGGTPYYAAADAIEQTLQDAGIPLDGIGVYVLPVSGTETSLLVLQTDIGASSSEEEAPEDITPALSALIDSEAVQSANISRVVLNLVGEDEQGPVVVTITMPLETLPAMLEGTLSEEETAAQLRIGVQRQ